MGIDLIDLAPVLGGHCHVAGRLSEIEGTWSTDEADPALRLHLARYSRYHGWHAELWSEMLPDSVGLADLAKAASPDETWSAQLDAVLPVAVTATRLAVLFRCLVPRLLTATDSLLERLDGVNDAATLRAGGFVRADLVGELIEGGRLLHTRIAGDDLAAALAAAALIDTALSASQFGS